MQPRGIRNFVQMPAYCHHSLKLLVFFLQPKIKGEKNQSRGQSLNLLSIVFYSLDILEHYLIEDNFPVSLHYGANGYRLNSIPNFGH